MNLANWAKKRATIYNVYNAWKYTEHFNLPLIVSVDFNTALQEGRRIGLKATIFFFISVRVKKKQ
jgi:RNase P/RNase MRP subunit p30